jgi:hypothetical protein
MLQPWEPHGHCFSWAPEVLWPYVIGALITALAYLGISLSLLWLPPQGRQEKAITLLFAAFILLCGFTHVFAVWNLWHAHYQAEAWALLLTGAVSMTTLVTILYWRRPFLVQLMSVPYLQRRVAELEGRLRLQDLSDDERLADLNMRLRRLGERKAT